MNQKSLIMTVLLLVLSVGFSMSNDSTEEPTISRTEVTTSAVKSDAYDFPLKQGTKEWKEFKGNIVKRRKACQVPDKVLKQISTNGLVETVLNYPYLHEIYAYSSYEHGLKVVIRRFNGLRELLERKNAGIELVRIYNSLNIEKLKQMSFINRRLFDIELLLLRKEIYSNFDNKMKLNLILALLNKQIVRKKMNLNSRVFTAKLLAKIMEDANYAPYNNLIDVYDKTKTKKIYSNESKENIKYSELTKDIIELSRKFYNAKGGKYENK